MGKHLKLLMFLALLLLVPIGSEGVQAQSLDTSSYDEAYNVYREAVGDYREKHQEYVLARSQYLRYGTLTSREEAFDKTATMLEARDEVIITHLEALLERLEIAEGVNDLQRAESRVAIEEEIGWFTDHKNSISSAQTLNDLVKDSKQASTRHDKNYVKVVYQALLAISSGKLEDYQDRFTGNFDELNIKLTNIRLEDREDYKLNEFEIKKIDDWILEIRNLVTRSEEKQLEVDEEILGLTGNKRVNRNTYQKLLRTIREGLQHLLQASLHVNEIVREVKTLD